MSAQRERTVAVAAVPHQRQTVLWIIAILLAIIATALLTGRDSMLGIQAARGDSPMAGARGIFAFTGQLDKHSYGLFMMDVDSSNIWCYQYVSGTGRLKLVAARSFLYDRYLENYSVEEPSPDVVKQMLDDQRRIKKRLSRGGGAPDDPDNASLGTSVPDDVSDLTGDSPDDEED